MKQNTGACGESLFSKGSLPARLALLEGSVVGLKACAL